MRKSIVKIEVIYSDPLSDYIIQCKIEAIYSDPLSDYIIQCKIEAIYSDPLSDYVILHYTVQVAAFLYDDMTGYLASGRPNKRYTLRLR